MHTAQPSPSDTPAAPRTPPTVDCDLFIEVSTTKEPGGSHTASGQWFCGRRAAAGLGAGSSEPGRGRPAVGVTLGRGRGSVGSGQASPWGAFGLVGTSGAGGRHQAEAEWAPVLQARTSLRCLGLSPPAVKWAARCPPHLTGYGEKR